MSTGVPQPNWTQVPNVLLDEWLPLIDTLAELKVALAIVRATAGWHRDSAVLSLSQLQGATGLGRSAVVAGLKSAHERGYVDKVPVGVGFAYGLVVDGQVVRGSDHPQDGGSDERTSDSPSSGLPPSPTGGPPYKERGKNPSGGKKAPAEQGALLAAEDDPPTAPADPPRPCPAKVGTKKVAPAECELAWGVMDAFNEAFGTTVRAKGFVEKIIRRHREHPELELADHVRVIQGVKGGRKWWSGTPDPAIIYGSDEQFERSLANAPKVGTTSPSGSSVQSGDVQTPEDDGWGNLDKTVRYD